MDIAPPDDSVDTNLIVIVGRGEIDNFGFGPGGFIRKQIVFRPSEIANPLNKPDPLKPKPPPPVITVRHNPPWLLTATGNNRVIEQESYAEYICNDAGNWFELFFTWTGVANFENRLNLLGQRVDELEQRLIKLEYKRTKRAPKPTED